MQEIENNDLRCFLKILNDIVQDFIISDRFILYVKSKKKRWEYSYKMNQLILWYTDLKYIFINNLLSILNTVARLNSISKRCKNIWLQQFSNSRRILNIKNIVLVIGFDSIKMLYHVLGYYFLNLVNLKLANSKKWRLYDEWIK